jgi:hypothetical protein
VAYKLPEKPAPADEYVAITDIAGNLTGWVSRSSQRFISFDTDYTGEPVEGRFQWNSEDGVPEIGLAGGNVTLQIGLEQAMRAKNVSGFLIPNGKLVRISGASGSKPEIDLADPSSIATVGAIGMVTEDIANNQQGYVTTFGLVRDIDTSLFGEGVLLWLDFSGNFTNIRPVPPIWSVAIGTVIRSHATEGEVFVTIVVVPRLQGLSDVYVPPGRPLDGDILKWVAANSRFEVSAP